MEKTNRQNFSSIANRNIYAFAAILLAALTVYAPALCGQFLWDDLYLVADNPFFKSPIFVFEVFRHHLFLDSISAYYRPVQNLSYMFDYWLWDKNTFGYHLSNVFFHAFSGWLIYLLLKKLLPSLIKDREDKSPIPVVAWLVAFVWVIHPIHNAAVAYVSGRADSLATMFSVSAWLLYLRSGSIGRRQTRLVLSAVALALCLLALCSKEIAAIWMALFLIYSFVLDLKPDRGRALIAALLLLAVTGTYIDLRHLAATGNGVPTSASEPMGIRVLLMLRALGDYAGLLFVPWNLHMDRTVFAPNAYLNTSSWRASLNLEYLSVTGLLFISALLYMSLSKRPWQRLRVFGVIWFILGFLPVSNLFPLNAQVAEHWIYMPSIGFILFMAGCVMAMPARCHIPACRLIAIFAIGLGIRTSIRSDDWRNGETFFQRTIEAGGGTPRVHLNLASVYTQRGDDISAESILRETVRRFPDYATARINLGVSLMKQGKVKEAESYLTYNKPDMDSLSNKFSRTWCASLNLAQIRSKENKKDEAIVIVDDAIARNPDVWDLVQFKSKLLEDSGKLPLAIATVDRYADDHWWHYGSHLLLGRLLSIDNQLDAARTALENAAALDIHGVEPFTLLAHVELSRHQPEKACDAMHKAIRRDPNQPTEYLLLAAILEQLGKNKEADQALESAEQLRLAANGHY